MFKKIWGFKDQKVFLFVVSVYCYLPYSLMPKALEFWDEDDLSSWFKVEGHPQVKQLRISSGYHFWELTQEDWAFFSKGLINASTASLLYNKLVCHHSRFSGNREISSNDNYDNKQVQNQRAQIKVGTSNKEQNQTEKERKKKEKQKREQERRNREQERQKKEQERQNREQERQQREKMKREREKQEERDRIEREREKKEFDEYNSMLLMYQLEKEEKEKQIQDEYECPICYEVLKKHNEFKLFKCNHSIGCFNCAGEMIEVSINDGKIPNCSFCDELCSDGDVSLIADFLQKPEIHIKYSQLMLRVGINNMKDAFPCPTPECKNWTYSSDSIDRFGRCNMCGESICTSCGKRYHHCGNCKDLNQIFNKWNEWVLRGRKQFNEQTQKQLQREEEIKQRLEELKRDEAWKVQNLKLCPNCGRGIEKLSGCNSMVCGQDAHGGNQQNGCGKKFTWTSARNYVSVIQENQFKAYKFDGCTTNHNLECTSCGENIVGLRFQCISCPYENLCLRCDALCEHEESHIFIIHEKIEI